MLTREQIVDLVRVFLPDSSNEARLVDQIDAHIAKVVDLGFLRQVRGRRATVRGPPHPQGLRRRPVAGRLRRARGYAARYRAELDAAAAEDDD